MGPPMYYFMVEAHFLSCRVKEEKIDHDVFSKLGTKEEM